MEHTLIAMNIITEQNCLKNKKMYLDGTLRNKLGPFGFHVDFKHDVLCSTTQ